MWKQSLNRFAMLTLCGALSLPGAHAQDDDKPDAKAKEEVSAEKPVTVRFASGKHWIGVLAVPIDESLKAQLNLQDRLVVHHVLPDSPAGKAGLQAHDILLKYGDKEITRLQDLVSAVADSGETESKLTVLRGGKETTLSIKPGERPAEEKLQELLPKDKSETARWLDLERKLDHDNTFIWRGVGPGVVVSKMMKQVEFPAGLTITVSKENEQPAKIVAKKDNKTYETTADKLEILPEDIRGHVERLLRGPQVMAFAPGAAAKDVDGALRLRVHGEQLKDFHKQAEANRKVFEEKVRQVETDAAKKLHQHIEIRKLEGGGVAELRKEVEELRKAVEELKGSKKSQEDKGQNKEDEKTDKS